MVVETLAATVVSQVLLPFAKMGAKKLGQTVADEFDQAEGNFAVDVAKKAWNLVTSAFDSPEDKARLEQFEKSPEKSRPLIEAILQEKLDQNQQLMEELSTLVSKPAPESGRSGAQIIGATYAGIVEIAGDVSGGTNVGLNIGAPLPTSTQQPRSGGSAADAKTSEVG